MFCHDRCGNSLPVGASAAIAGLGLRKVSNERELQLTVLGAGYLGITHAACMASLGFDVLGVDTDAARVDQLNSGHLPIYEPGLEELLRSGLGAGRVRFTTSHPEAAAFGDVHFICTGTPHRWAATAPIRPQVHACVTALAPLLDRPCLVVGKFTVPVVPRGGSPPSSARPAPVPSWRGTRSSFARATPWPTPSRRTGIVIGVHAPGTRSEPVGRAALRDGRRGR